MPFDRATLRQPFFAQCYIAGPAALALGIAAIMIRAHQPAIILGGFVLALISIAWYLRIEIVWLRRNTHMTRLRATGSAIVTWLAGSIFNGIATALILGV